MNTLTLVIAAAGLFTLLFLYARLVVQREPTVEELMRDMTYEIDKVRVAINEELRPALVEAAAAMREFAKAFK